MTLFSSTLTTVKTLALGAAILASGMFAQADIGIISPAEAKKLIENPDAKSRSNCNSSWSNRLFSICF